MNTTSDKHSSDAHLELPKISYPRVAAGFQEQKTEEPTPPPLPYEDEVYDAMLEQHFENHKAGIEGSMDRAVALIEEQYRERRDWEASQPIQLNFPQVARIRVTEDLARQALENLHTDKSPKVNVTANFNMEDLEDTEIPLSELNTYEIAWYPDANRERFIIYFVFADGVIINESGFGDGPECPDLSDTVEGELVRAIIAKFETKKNVLREARLEIAKQLAPNNRDLQHILMLSMQTSGSMQPEPTVVEEGIEFYDVGAFDGYVGVKSGHVYTLQHEASLIRVIQPGDPDYTSEEDLRRSGWGRLIEVSRGEMDAALERYNTRGELIVPIVRKVAEGKH